MLGLPSPVAELSHHPVMGGERRRGEGRGGKRREVGEGKKVHEGEKGRGGE